MTDAINIREVTKDDFESVTSLLEELGRPGVLGNEDEDALRRLFVEYIDRSDTVCLVAELGGGAVGFLDMEYRPRLNFKTPQAWVPDLIVSEGNRSAGVGAALLSRAEEMAKARGCWGMSLESANWRTRAHAFYVREGWADSGKSFTKGLTDQPWPPAPKE